MVCSHILRSRGWGLARAMGWSCHVLVGCLGFPAHLPTPGRFIPPALLLAPSAGGVLGAPRCVPLSCCVPNPAWLREQQLGHRREPLVHCLLLVWPRTQGPANSEPTKPPPPKTAPGGAGVPLYPLLHMDRGNSWGLEVSGNTRSCCGSLRDSVSPLLGAGGVQLTSATVMGTYTGHGHPCRRSKVFQQGRGARVMPALPCWHMDRLLSEAGVSQALGINRCAAGSSGADPGARRWGWRQVHWEKPARGRVGGNRFPQELRTNLAPWGGGKQPLARLPAAPSGGNEAEAPNPSLQSVLCSQGSRCRSRHRDLGAMRDVLGGTLWDSPAWEQVLGQGVGLGWGWGAVFYC